MSDERNTPIPKRKKKGTHRKENLEESRPRRDDAGLNGDKNWNMAEELITSAYLVALGNNRNNGRSLGLFTINANNALNNANANNWRPRLSSRTREAFTCRKALHLNRSCLKGSIPRRGDTTQGIQEPGAGVYVRLAVKDLHTTCVSRSGRNIHPFSGTHSRKGEWLDAA